MGGCGNCCVMDNPVGDFFRDLFGDSSGGCGYHPGPSATEAHSKKIADELAEMRNNMGEFSKATETKIIEDINQSMNQLLSKLEKINNQVFGGKKLHINISGLKEKYTSLKNEVPGSIGKHLEDRLVLTDKELSVILEERDDQKRNKNFDSFCERVKKEAIDVLSKKIKTTVTNQENLIRDAIKARLTEVDKNMRDVSHTYSQLILTKETNEAQIEELQSSYVYQIELTNILLDILSE